MLVGRAAELDRVDRLVADVLAGENGALLVVGDPGSGRTTLLDAAARRAARRGAQVARMRAVPQTPPAPFALVTDLLRVLGRPRVRTPAEPAATGALVDAIVDATTRGPLLLVVDDLTDADPASARVLTVAVGRTSDRPVATLAVGTTVPGRGATAADPRWPRLVLEDLAVDAGRAVVRATLGPHAAEAVVAALVSEVGGNPGALVAGARSLTPAQAAGRDALPDRLPVGAAIAAAWSPVLDDLPAAATRALLALAVVGSEDPRLLAAALAASGGGVADLVPAEARGLVRFPAPGRVDVRDRVLRAVVLDRADAGAVRHLHRLAAEAGARGGTDPSAVCHHLVRSTVLPDASVADELHRQAERCLALGRVGAAASALQEAARLTPDPSLRRSRAMAAVRQRVETDMEGISSRDLLDLVGPGPLPAGGEGWLRWLQVLSQPDLPTQLEAALAGAGAARSASDPGLLRTLLWAAAETAWEVGRADLGLELAHEYAELDGRGVPSERDEPAWTSDALMAAALTQVGRLAEARPLRRRVLARADALDPVTCSLPLLLDAVGLDDTLLADTAGSDARIACAVTRADAAGYEPVACLWGIRAWRERGRGAWQAALRWRDEGLAVSVESRAPATVCGLLALSVELGALQGDERRLHDDADALRRLAGGYGDVRRLLTLERALAMDALARGELAGAVAHLQEAADVSFLGRGLRDAVLSSRVDLVEVLMRLGDADAARGRAQAAVVLLEQVGQPLASAWACRVRALTAGDDERAETWFGRALAAHARSNDPFEQGRTELLLGEHLRRARRRADARRHLAHAQALFTRLGAQPWERRAAQELRVAGGGVQPAALGFADLTPQELHVALAVAGGRSTREVADLLVLSPRTVESHLGRVYRKLGVSGRAALASVMTGASATTGEAGSG